MCLADIIQLSDYLVRDKGSHPLATEECVYMSLIRGLKRYALIAHIWGNQTHPNVF